MKKMLFIVVMVSIVIASGCLTYAHLETAHKGEYKNGVFVERENHNEYAKVYSLCQSI